jgi:hypothetical protein
MSDTHVKRARTPEQEARDIMERIGVTQPDPQSFSSGDVIELANIIHATWALDPVAIGDIRRAAQVLYTISHIAGGTSPASKDLYDCAQRLFALIHTIESLVPGAKP